MFTRIWGQRGLFLYLKTVQNLLLTKNCGASESATLIKSHHLKKTESTYDRKDRVL